MNVRRYLLPLGFVTLPALLSAATVIDFESFNDSDIITNQLSGLTFTNTIVLSSGISLNEFEFPPHSGSNVVSDNGGPITVTFDTPVTSVGGYFTYAEPFTLTAFDASNAQLANAASAFSNNEGLSGDAGSSPNEFVGVAASGISSVTLQADPLGGSFVLDDLTYDTALSASAPEPSALVLVLGGVPFVWLRSRRRA